MASASRWILRGVLLILGVGLLSMHSVASPADVHGPPASLVGTVAEVHAKSEPAHHGAGHSTPMLHVAAACIAVLAAAGLGLVAGPGRRVSRGPSLLSSEPRHQMGRRPVHPPGFSTMTLGIARC